MNTQQQLFRQFVTRTAKRAVTVTPRGVTQVTQRKFFPVKRSQVNHSHHQVIH